MDQHIIQTFGLTRRFGHLVAVDQIDLHVPQGSVYSFLGPNGAGKTTTIRMLLGLIRPDAGKVALFGSALDEERLAILRRVGSLVETPSLYPHLTGRENLEVIRRMTGGTSRADRARAVHRTDGRRCAPASGALFDGDAAAPRVGHRSAGRAGTADPGRADERTRPGGHSRNPRADLRASAASRRDRVCVQPPAERGRADGGARRVRAHRHH